VRQVKVSGVTYGNWGGRVQVTKVRDKTTPTRSAEEVVREIKTAQLSGEGEYRERSLALHGSICGRCGREFTPATRHLLTVHHRDGNHRNNPPDGSNWENLCVYCHEDVHSRGLLGDYLAGTDGSREETVVYRDEPPPGAPQLGTLGDRLQKALEKKKTPP
jgi:plasmid stability protein